MDLRVLARVAIKLIRGLPGHGDSGIRKDAAFEPAGKILIQNVRHKIRAIPGNEIEMRNLTAVIQAGNQGVILIGGGLKSEGIDAALVCRPHQLIPPRHQSSALRHIAAQNHQFRIVIGLTQFRNRLVVHS